MTRLKLLTASAIAASLLFAQVPAHGQATTTSTKKTTKTPKVHKETETEKQIRELREKLAEQQGEINSLKTDKATSESQLSTAQQTAADAQTKANEAATEAAAAQAAATAAAAKTDAVSSSVTDLKSTTAGLTDTVLSTQKKVQEEIESPSTIHYKGITITPVAFAAFEGVWRQHAVNSDVNTPFNNIPLPSANEGHVSELNFTGRQSRLGVYFQGDAGSAKLSSYYEMDFLGTGTSSNNNQSNSYVLRQRQIWAQAAFKGGMTITGGQMWSLVTEDRKGTDAKTEIQPNTVDSQYLVGYSWTRQPGLRIQQKFGDYKTGALTTALSVEQAQITNFTASNLPSAFLYFFGATGQNGGLYNAAAAAPANNVAAADAAVSTYANNVVPDVIVKAAYDHSGFHVEVGGIGRFFRDYYFPITDGGTAGAPTYSFPTTSTVNEKEVANTKAVGGVFGSVRGYFGKYLEVAAQGMAGQGVGRYGSAQLADATLRPDETLEPIRNYHGLASIETHPSSKFDVYGYYGGEYAQRTTYILPVTGVVIGYGPKTLSDAGCYNLPVSTGGNTGGTGGSISAAGCASPTRYIQEAMGGVTYKAINSPKYGRLQYQLTYSYIQRNLWSGVGSGTTPTGPRGTENMIHVSMRYYIP
jgi:multidrug efflux pump subunit AcrA (membrane-fusion protein)